MNKQIRMANIPENIKFLILKWKSGSLTAQEQDMLDTWYNEELPTELEWYGEDEAALKERMFSAVQAVADADGGQAGVRRPVRRLWWAASAVAAAALLFVMLRPYFHAGLGQANELLTAAASTQQIRKIILPDQSIVWLKGDSKLKYPAVFGSHLREVELIGEALFEVSKDKDRPFIIRAADYTTKVLGTSFNLKVDAKTGGLDLAVLTGTVEVTKKAAGIGAPTKYKVEANETLRSTADQWEKPTVALPEKQIASLTAGTEYDMNFVSEPVEHIMKRFEEKFNVSFEGYTGEYRSCNVTADLTDQSLEKSLKLLSLSINADFKVTDNTVRLTGGGCF